MVPVKRRDVMNMLYVKNVIERSLIISSTSIDCLNDWAFCMEAFCSSNTHNHSPFFLSFLARRFASRLASIFFYWIPLSLSASPYFRITYAPSFFSRPSYWCFFLGAHTCCSSTMSCASDYRFVYSETRILRRRCVAAGTYCHRISPSSAH